MITGGQLTAGTASAALTRVPPGPCWVTLTNAGTVTVYVGLGGTATATAGFPVPSGGVVPLAGFQGDAGQQLSVVTAGGSAPVGWLVSTAAGQTGP